MDQVLFFIAHNLSHMSFWGKRKDILVDIDDIKYFSDTRNTGNPSQNVFWKVQFYDPKLSTMFISTRYGGIEDPETFRYIQLPGVTAHVQRVHLHPLISSNGCTRPDKELSHEWPFFSSKRSFNSPKRTFWCKKCGTISNFGVVRSPIYT